MAKIRDMLNDGSIRKFQFDAWQKTATGQQTGNQQLVWDGNQDLLEFEQRVTLQNGAYAADLAYFKHITNTWVPGVPALDSPTPRRPEYVSVIPHRGGRR